MDLQIFQAYTLDFLPEDINKHELTGDEIRVHRFVLEGWLQRAEFQNGKPLLARLISSTGITRVCCVGSPHFQKREHIYVPQWLMENLGIDSEQDIHLELISDDISNASKIYLKPLDNAIYHTDIRECFERGLDMFHVIESGTMLTVEVESLGGYKVYAYVDKVEPEILGRLGGEVEVEFLEPDGGVPEFARPPTPIPPITDVSEEVLIPAHDNSIVEQVQPDYNKIREEVRTSWLKKFKK